MSLRARARPATRATRALVCLHAGGTTYAVDVARAGRVLPHDTLDALPEPRPGVLGLRPHADGRLPVLAPFGPDGRHVLVVESGGITFGVLVDEVTGVVRVADEDVLPAPPGQAAPVVAGVVHGAAGGALLVDCDVLAARLAP